MTDPAPIIARYRALLQVAEAIAVRRDLPDLFHDLAQRLPDVVAFDVISLILHDAERNTMRLHLLESRKPHHAPPCMELPIGEGPGGVVWQTQQPLNLTDADVAARFPKVSPVLQQHGVLSLCVLPLTTAVRRLGAIGFGSERAGAFGPDELEFLRLVATQVAVAVDNALAYREIAELKDKLATEKLYLEEEIRTEYNFASIVGDSPALTRVLKQVEIVAPTDSTVLILGETGTGKELIARAIHELSGRRDRTFAKLNCAAIPTGLLESELFGHEKGAFTGAIAQKAGRFELADGGTLFLDEVGDIPLELQSKLLRVLQEQEFERLGGTRTLRVDVRLVAATNRDLARMVADKQFRSDLYYRLNVFPVSVPPLRERRPDIAPLIRHFAAKYAARMNKRIESIPSQTIDALAAYPWPGNVRELENLIERAVILSPGPELRVPLGEIERPAVAGPAAATQTLEEAEREHILRVLGETRWVIAGPAGAAARLGMKRTTLQSRMQKLGIGRPAAR
jgi:formate hydrogenlyase transcriptional activator